MGHRNFVFRTFKHIYSRLILSDYLETLEAESPIKETMRKFEAKKFRILNFLQWSSHLFCIFLQGRFTMHLLSWKGR